MRSVLRTWAKRGRWLRRGLAPAAALGGLLVFAAAAPAIAAEAPDDTLAAVAPAPSLVLEDIELVGATRTPLATVYRDLPLRPGRPIDQAALVAAVEDLREAELFASVQFYTRRGSERGHVVLVLEVKEHGLDFRWAAGNTNLDGWYLVPAMVSLDNPTGRGDRLDLQLRWGFRHGGFLLRYAQPGAGRDAWGLQLSAISTDLAWFRDGVEYRHNVKTLGLSGAYDRRWGERWWGEAGLNFEGVKTAGHSTATTESADGTITFDDRISGDELPAAIRDVVGDEARVIAHCDLQHDTRAARLRAGTPVDGVWGRVKAHGALQGKRSHVGLLADLRAYREVPGGVLAARLRGAVVTDNAAFYDRLYLGGMYTVRGFPAHSLSTPGGDTWLWSGSLEYRSCILGDARGAKLAGLFFVDAGAAGEAAHDAFGGVSAGAGYGVRLRAAWVDWIGVDVGFPLTTRPLDQRFQATASIGWSF